MKPISTQQTIVWTIAGSDSGGGAGIQADLKTFADFAVHGCSVITAITAQNSLGVQQISVVPQESIKAQIASLSSDLPAPALKLGMLAEERVLKQVGAFLRDYSGLVVCDPVLVASSGSPLLNESAQRLLRQEILPLVDILTPNVAEAEQLLQRTINTGDETGLEIERAGKDLLALGAKAVLITGGDTTVLADTCADYFVNDEASFWLLAKRIDSAHNHGTGCTFSAALTACMAKGYDVLDALVIAKAYVTQGIRYAKPLGKGPGPVAHRGWPLSLEDYPRVYKHLSDVSQPLAFTSCETENLGLYPVVDSVEWMEKLLPLGVETIQLRIKDVSVENLDKQIAQGVKIAEQFQSRLFINDYWQLAIKHGAYGVHLGQEDLDDADLKKIAEAGLRLGVSTHSYWEIARARAVRPSYIAIGPIYETTTKVMKFSEQGLDQLRQWVDLLKQDYPLVAIGGIDYDRAKAVLSTGVGSVALVSAITQAEDYLEATSQLLSLFD